MGTSGSLSELTGMMGKLRNLFHDESGVSVTEYGLVLLLIITIIVGVLGLLGTSISGRFTDYANQFGS
jgi:Flp pilus assembly pilin Flp